MTAERWRRVKEVFQSAAKRPPADRAAYLAAEAAGDDELRREVEKMLRHATGAGLLDRPAWDGLRLDGELAAGARLGPYEILEEAGSGGMGRVYKARDTRLGRTVAIKVLSAEFSHRFQAEARAISALNHPHVCALYDIGEQEGAAYLVMEYVEGESLAARLAAGPLPLEMVLRYGEEIADALAAAHSQGIVHRDLKPANIMITKSGAKVLDFGVARMAGDGDDAGGTVVGTLAYMSPSQLNGNTAHARSDIFALGMVLNEMVTDAPAELANLIRRCLREEGASRIQSMEEVRRALERMRSAPPPAKTRWLPAASSVVLLAMAVSGAVLLWKPTRPAKPAPVTAPVAITSPAESRVPPEKIPGTAAAPPPHVAPPPAMEPAPYVPPLFPVVLTSYPGQKRDPEFSPDGRSVAFSWHGAARRTYGIYVRPVSTDAEPRSLTDGSVEDWGPAWSPDGRTIAFRRSGAQSGIYRVPASGGPASLVAPIARQGQETLPQMSWSRDGKWIAAPDRDPDGGTQIYLFPTGPGEKRRITSNSTGTDQSPAFSPDGKLLAYASCVAGVFPCDVYVLEMGPDGLPKGQRRITRQGTYIRGIAWLPDSRGLVYASGARVSMDTYLWQVAVNPPGPPQRVDEAGSRVRHPSVSPAGGLLAYTNSGSWNLMLIENFR